ncbi:hypothetical protein BaRGS_00034268 [Batillaria attramentaria]|uniref:SOCS box domain-containing protein n=1 Tax=Batillaria attramentaria TaxID=370345 RepID=A0ABD0JHT9_9CAEN
MDEATDPAHLLQNQGDHVVHNNHQDISTERREVELLEAVQDGRWERVTQIVQEGVSLQCRDTVVEEAVKRGQWGCVLVLAQLGICPGQSQLVVKEAVSQNQWENVPKLVKSCNRPELTDLALREAVNRSQWNCVRHLVNLGLLTKDQRDFVSQEAVPLGHIDCSVDLLRQGVSPGHAQWILSVVFRRTVDRMRQGLRLSEDDSKRVFRTAVRLRQWGAFKLVLQYQRPSDQTVREAMAVAVITLDHDFVQTLIRSTRNGLRVFKHLCLKEQWSTPIASLLCVNLCPQERDLAFLVAATQGLWTYALELYEDESVSKNSRRFALRRATRRGIWHLVVRMASKGVTEQNERRRAFLGVVRQGEWSWALKLLDAGVNVKKRDVRFTVQTCLCLKLWQGVVEVCLRFDALAIGKRLVRRVLQTAIRNRQLDDFVRLWNALQMTHWSDVVQSLIRRAFESRRCKFVETLCQSDELLNDLYIVNVAIEEAIAARKWNFIRNVVGDGAVSITDGQFLLILENIVSSRTSWKLVVPILEETCKNDDFDVLELLHEPPDTFDGSALAEWCAKRSFTNVSLFLRLLSKQLSGFDAELENHAETICLNFKEAAFHIAAEIGEWDLAVNFLKHLELEKYVESVLDSIWDDPIALFTLIETCRRKGLRKWAVYLGIAFHTWDIVEAEMETCSDQDLIDHTIQEAAAAGIWDLVTNIFDKCSGRDDILAEIFESAVEYGNVRYATLLLERVDFSSIFLSKSPLSSAVGSFSNREKMTRLCISAGFSPHQRLLQGSPNSPMRRALRDAKLRLVRLLHMSGSCPNSELHRLRNDQGIRAQLQQQGRQRILQYLDNAAANPASLQHLCRLTVARLVGYRRGRRERVRSLPVPEHLRDYIMFSEYSDIPSGGS